MISYKVINAKCLSKRIIQLYEYSFKSNIRRKINLNSGGKQKMPNKKTIALTQKQYKNIINTIKTGSTFFRANQKIATCLVLEANLGLRISDILNIKLSSIIKDGNRYRLDITEKKTSKKRVFTVPLPIYQYIQIYCMKNNIKENETIFKMTERNIQKYIQKVTDYLGYKDISTHSFRKFFATEIYLNNKYNIILTQQLLQHSSPSITQRYIGITSEEIENALSKHISLI